ncbi:DUF397 domain-containing protein [Streptomyces sp. NPDC005492]|uniref:DUF397 domain-containing protein n=1 Tax=Streptomyces sp. NPDC005492 TaxID=3156883 RepID=UPI0033B4D2AB
MNNWRKSSYSGPDDGNNCVEIANSPAHARVSIRDSKAPAGAMLSFPSGAFGAFIVTLKTDSEQRRTAM